jgi:hypothetical protein
MKPEEHLLSIAALDLQARFANGNILLIQLLRVLVHFFQNDLGQHCRRPEARNGAHAHLLMLIQVQFFLPTSLTKMQTKLGEVTDGNSADKSFSQ